MDRSPLGFHNTGYICASENLALSGSISEQKHEPQLQILYCTMLNIFILGVKLYKCQNCNRAFIWH